MSKYSGNIGFVVPVETAPGIWVESPIERHYHGDILQNRKNWQVGTGINDDLRLNVRISVVSDAYLNVHRSQIAYVSYAGAKWKVTDIEDQRPRLIFSIGGVYNEG